uniref:Uncharacterized protein n=1 Tax=uncultured marine virus TaxID=186617 RepID=A0A0F7L4G1_9VIRU|nr:hypothetical protein [uncultured marine virus]
MSLWSCSEASVSCDSLRQSSQSDRSPHSEFRYQVRAERHPCRIPEDSRLGGRRLPLSRIQRPRRSYRLPSNSTPRAQSL